MLQRITKKWKKPKESQIKFNWDVAIKVSKNCSGFGGLARNAASEVLAAFSSSLPSTLQLIIVETMALRKTLILSKKLGFANILFEEDCLQVVKVVNNQLSTHDGLWSILYDILRLLEYESH